MNDPIISPDGFWQWFHAERRWIPVPQKPPELPDLISPELYDAFQDTLRELRRRIWRIETALYRLSEATHEILNDIGLDQLADDPSP